MHKPILSKNTVFTLFFFVIPWITGCTLLTRELFLKEDSLAEEMLEEEIKQNLGWEIDLTPTSPEDD